MDGIIIVDFGSQTTKLIAKQIRKLNVFCQIIPYHKFNSYHLKYDGIILSGSPANINDLANTEYLNFKNLIQKCQIPILGICFGAQLIASYYNAKIKACNKREFGRTEIYINQLDTIVENIPTQKFDVWMSHNQNIDIGLNSMENEMENELLQLISLTKNDVVSIFKVKNRNIYGLQFHPEVFHTQYGSQIFDNFVKISKCNRNWFPGNIVNKLVENIKTSVGNNKVIMAVSGGVDSSVAATLIHKAIGNNLVCIFVDNGLLRYKEVENIMNTYCEMNLNVIKLDYSELFYDKLHNITDPEEKRKIIGHTFIDVFTKYASEHNLLNPEYFLGQGTIYPDIIESGSNIGGSLGDKLKTHKIKSHHNVGGLPDKLPLKLLEPLKHMFKYEVRDIGKELEIPESILNRHPFPGPGLAIRIIGSLDANKIKLLRQVDHIYIELLKEEGLYHKIWQAGTILLPICSTGVMGDASSYMGVVALRAVTSVDGMTANIFHFDCEFLEKVSTRIINQVSGINRVVYDISNKLPFVKLLQVSYKFQL